MLPTTSHVGPRCVVKVGTAGEGFCESINRMTHPNDIGKQWPQGRRIWTIFSLVCSRGKGGGGAAYIQRNRRKKALRKVQGEERSDASFATHMLSIGAFCHKSCYRKLDDKGMLRI